jgi:hypothetical protein
MTERTVTEQKVVSALANVFARTSKHNLGVQCLQHYITAGLLKELFPEPPQVGEIILGISLLSGQTGWGRFLHFTDDGAVCTHDGNSTKTIWSKYRRQTAIEKGEK